MTHPTSPDHALPLAGITVVAIEQALAAPLCTCRLADMGARVIKIERPEGDFARGYDAAANGSSSYFLWTNRGKESVVLDFKQPDDAALLHRLIASADVFVQNLAPGALTRAGFDSATLRERHPRLITCDITGYGTGSETSKLKAYDFLVQCESGLVSVSGAPDHPGRIGVSICDIGAGMNATIAVLSALALRSRTGAGSGVSVSLFDGAADWMSVPYVHERYGNGAPAPQGLKHPSIAPYGAYRTRDARDIVISIQNDREWAKFCAVFLGDADIANDARFQTNNARVQNREALDTLIGAAFAARPLVEALSLLGDASIAYGQLRAVADMAVHPALRTWPMATGGEPLQMIAPPVRAPWDAQRFEAAPKLGEHTARIRAEFAGVAEEASA
ncbi:CaiB/BaiF CoA transferase family protein [Paraburkholderia unamae]|uniref:Crotonobetainyl-CoA:carnitine CoA-transferase CaiB-like acyl-CoA transferase n=1 Tax=Paraburkholderia unamae TaxID=219649 RepID=A0ABX5KF43_9BURK|nr:CaiB/BaiF CoA-transferase family protein [Paraburkholderia unamae]PVX72794.1 crotonobetainyl-CoA:carnitine CoA-transferase CaiB-like acyl-CoA transferase [Paraburkholderia unamae]CAG9272484.1 CoA transferase [Paraburkholderia unamae]